MSRKAPEAGQVTVQSLPAAAEMGGPLELPIVLRRSSETSLPVQLAAALREAVDRHLLKPGERLPASRAFAARLGVARGVVVAAYEQLAAEGYVLAGHGRGTIVHPNILVATTRPAQLTPEPETPLPSTGRRQESYELATPPLAVGAPDTTAVNTPQWRAAWRKAATQAGYPAPLLGDRRFRAEISEHLRRMRGTNRTVDDIIVTAGARDGLHLLLTALETHRGRPLIVGVEDPGFPSLRRVAARNAQHIVALRVDEHGLDTGALPASGVDVVIVTPSHQYPLGSSLPLNRRRELLVWANRTGAVIIEDDYDSELRYVGAPVPALAALDDPVAGSVALLGTFSKTVSPALSAGYIVASERLRALIEPVRRDLASPVSAVVQRALAEYLASGELRRHTARMRRRYGQRRELVQQYLGSVAGVRVMPMNGGLHAVIEFEGEWSPGQKHQGMEPSDTRPGALAEAERRVCAQLATYGVVRLSEYWQHSAAAAPERYGLVLGMGGSDSASVESALQRVRDTLQQNL